MTDTLLAAEKMAETKSWWERRNETVKLLSRYLGVHQSEIARTMGYSRQTIHGRLVGATQMELWELAGFAVALGVPEDVLWMAPEEAVKWCIENPEVVVRSRCSAGKGQHRKCA